MPGIDNRKENGYQAMVVIDRPIGNGLYSFHNVLRVLSGGPTKCQCIITAGTAVVYKAKPAKTMTNKGNVSFCLFAET